MENTTTEEERKNKWDEALHNSPWFLMSKKRFAIMVMFLVIFTITIMCGGGYYLYLVQQGKLTPSIDIAPIFDPTVNVAGDQIDNQYDFNPTTENEYDVKVYVDLGDMVCVKKGDYNETD